METMAGNRHDNYCIHHLFEAHSLRIPDAAAAVFNENELTYRELNQRSNQLAHFLRSLNLKPDMLVGIFMDRSIEMLIALLGILKAGAAYVPLDPDYPKERLEYMIKDAGTHVLLTQESYRKELALLSDTIVCLDSDWSRIAANSAENPATLDDGQNVSPENLAYVIYTSGSTGNPKGVQVPHRAVVNFLLSMADKPGITETDTLLAVTTLSFDISVLELFLPICCGACTVIADRDTVSDGRRLLQTLIDSKTTIMQATPVTWRMLIESGWDGSQKIKALCGGEALPRDLANNLIDRCQSVWNMYGPTETTVWSTCFRLQDKKGPVLIGRPIANTPVYILDKHMQPVPVGVSGELYIGGAGVARGYLNRPDLTSEVFLKNPFIPDPNALIYKTGDLTRYHSDGNIEYLNRIDHQIKIRGFRIELGEIESVLLKHPSINHGVVVVREDRPGDTRLAAYIVPNKDQPVDTAELRQFLRQKLPEYMVPQYFVTLDALPMTPNGKINRKVLPKPQPGAFETENYVAPKTPVEKQLADIWSIVLNENKIGLNDSFFDIGGHSILATQMISRVREMFSVELALRKVFETPTLIELARHIEALQFAGSSRIPAAENEAREEIEF